MSQCLATVLDYSHWCKPSISRELNFGFAKLSPLIGCNYDILFLNLTNQVAYLLFVHKYLCTLTDMFILFEASL
jgi:hypothetical protein